MLEAEVTAGLSPALTATNISDQQILVYCRFRGSERQPTEAVLLHAHTLATFWRHLKHFYFSFY